MKRQRFKFKLLAFFLFALFALLGTTFCFCARTRGFFA